jgi:hypothetical protein
MPFSNQLQIVIVWALPAHRCWHYKENAKKNKELYLNAGPCKEPADFVVAEVDGCAVISGR